MELQTFKHEQFGDLRIMDEDGVVWFIGKDVAAILGYSDTAAAIKRHVDDEDKLTRRFVDSGQNRTMYIIFQERETILWNYKLLNTNNLAI